MLYKQKRLNRLFNKSGKIILTPLDHGVTMGPISGLENIGNKIESLLSSKVDSLVLHKGLIINNYSKLTNRDTGLIMHLSASTNISLNPGFKTQVATVDEAIALGCDGVSVHVNIGDKYENQMLKDFASISKECNQKGMPLLAMMYARGNNITKENDVIYVKHLARIAEELGADIVKVNYTGDIESFSDVISSCSIPVIIAGGSKIDEFNFLSMVCDAITAGASGISVGRNIFQSKNLELLIKSCIDIVHNGKSLNDLPFKSIEEMSTSI